MIRLISLFFFFFFFNDTATTEIYTLSLHDALPPSSPASHNRLKAGSCTKRDHRITSEVRRHQSPRHAAIADPRSSGDQPKRARLMQFPRVVIPHRRPRVRMGGCLLDIAQRDPGVQGGGDERVPKRV